MCVCRQLVRHHLFHQLFLDAVVAAFLHFAISAHKYMDAAIVTGYCLLHFRKQKRKSSIPYYAVVMMWRLLSFARSLDWFWCSPCSKRLSVRLYCMFVCTLHIASWPHSHSRFSSRSFTLHFGRMAKRHTINENILQI